MLEIVVEIIFEILIEVLCEIAIELGFGSIVNSFYKKKNVNPIIAYIGIALFGLILGFVFTLIFSDRIIVDPLFKGISLIISPLAAGLTLYLFGNWRREKGHNTTYLATFWGGSLFAFSFALIRLIMI